MMKKFLLFNSPIFGDATNDNEDYLSPLGLGYIATYLKKAGINVELIDCVKEKLGTREILERISKEKPYCIGFNIFTQNYSIVKYVMEHIEHECESFIGGQAVKSIYNRILEWEVNGRLNIIIGEGEYIIPAIVKNEIDELPFLERQKKRVYKVDSGSKYFPRKISDIFLDRSFLKNEIIVNHYGENEAAIITSRGCIYNCAFCGGAKELNGDIVSRVRDAKSIKKEITEILQLYPDVTSIRILDDLFLRDTKSLEKATEIFSDYTNLHWRGMAHVLTFARIPERIYELKKSKCKELFIGIESGSDKIRKRINKLGTIQEIIEVSSEILKNGIDLKGYFMYGFPGETKEDFEDTYRLANEIKRLSQKYEGDFRTSVFQFRPYHGTKLYNELLLEKGEIPECVHNDEIGTYGGREQFNFSSGNYSVEKNDILNEYIKRTQRIMEE